MPPKKFKIPSMKIGVVFTKTQVDIIDSLVNRGELGSSRAEVVKQIVMFYLRDWEKKTTTFS